MLLNYLYIIFSTIFSLFGTDIVLINSNQENNQPNPQFVFEKIVSGIESGKVTEFSNYFSSQVYLSLNSGERGYYSKNQTFYLLQGYFQTYKPSNFRISSRLINSSNPYFAGKFNYNQKGKKGIVQVYIGLTLIENSWEITQITFN